MRRPAALGLATVGVFLLGYVLERLLVDAGVAATFPSPTATSVGAGALTGRTVAWLLMAISVGGLAWLLWRWADCDRISAVVVTALGAVAWLLPWLYYESPVASLLPNWVDRLIGRVQLIPITGAFVMVIGLEALLWRRSGPD